MRFRASDASERSERAPASGAGPGASASAPIGESEGRSPSDEFDQARTIARATFDGFLQSDLVPQGMQAPALIWAAAFLVGPALCLPVTYLQKYPFIRRFHPELLEGTLWGDRLLFVLMSAGAMGVVSVVLWETLFPARRDAFVLTPLPVSLPAQMLGRLGGLMILCLAFIVALNAVPSVTLPVATLPFLQMPRAAIAHVVSTAAADLFVFFSVTSLQGLIILSFGRRAATKLSPVVQALAVVGVLLTILFIGVIREATTAAIVRGHAADPLLAWNPAAWFLGLYELIAGTPRSLMTGLAARAVAAALAPAAITVAIYVFGYRRLLKRAVETPSRSTRSWFGRAASAATRLVFVRRPQEQAIVGFMLRAVARSSRHTMLMAIYTGLGLALVVTFMLTEFVRLGPATLTSPLAPWPARSAPPVALLVMPLVVSAALACGVRVLMTIPAEMNARWVFQTASITPRQADAAAHKALLLMVVPPVTLIAALSAGGLWGVGLGAVHAVYCGALAVLLCEILLVRYRGIPLTRPYIPGASRFHMLWAAYLSAFLTYTFSSISLEVALLRAVGPIGVVRAAAVIGGVALALWAWRKYKLREIDAVPFEADLPDDVAFRGFNLSEIHAAQSVASRGASERSL